MPDRFERLNVAGMTCGSCVAKIEHALEGPSGVEHVHVDLQQGTVMVSGGAALSRRDLEVAIRSAGFAVDGNTSSKDAETKVEASSFTPLLVAVSLIGLGSLASGGVDGFMAKFMGGFFLVFGGLKLLDLGGFASAYAKYDLLAAKLPAYGWVYPFVEVSLGLAYLATPEWTGLHAITFLLMTFSALGVIRALRRGEQLTCACMGTAFNLPMTTVTIVEDLGMAAMAGAMLVQLSM